LTYEKLQQTQQASFDTANAQAAQTYQDTQKDELDKFNQSQSDTIRNFQESELQAQETYQNSMADLNQSHKDKLQSLTESHDWLGMDAENKSYAEQKAQKTRDFTEADAQRRAQNAQTLSDAARNFKESQAEEKANYDASAKQRADAFKAQQKTDASNFTDEMNQLADNHIVKMAQLKANYDDQKTLEATAFQDQMNVLMSITTATETALANNYNAFLKSIGATGGGTNLVYGTPGPHDNGGYFIPGITRNGTGSSEWVLAPDTVKYAEGIVGGRLTQQNLIAAMIGGRSGMGGGSYSNSNTVNMSGLTAQDKLLIGGMMNKALREFSQKELS
jgi:membrane protein involved in colicin uptake